MVLHLAGRGGVTISPELRRRIAAKMAKMERLSPKLIEARVVLATERHRHLSEVTLHAKAFRGVRPGVLIAESIWPNEVFEDGKGINTLTGADQPAPAAGGAFHDNRVWLRPA